MCGRPILSTLQPEFELSKDNNPLLNEPAKPRPEENDRLQLRDSKPTDYCFIVKWNSQVKTDKF